MIFEMEIKAVIHKNPILSIFLYPLCVSIGAVVKNKNRLI